MHVSYRSKSSTPLFDFAEVLHAYKRFTINNKGRQKLKAEYDFFNTKVPKLCSIVRLFMSLWRRRVSRSQLLIFWVRCCYRTEFPFKVYFGIETWFQALTSCAFWNDLEFLQQTFCFHVVCLWETIETRSSSSASVSPDNLNISEAKRKSSCWCSFSGLFKWFFFLCLAIIKCIL